jgi:multicomponent Na+:H+ antiporter subunit D
MSAAEAWMAAAVAVPIASAALLFALPSRWSVTGGVGASMASVVAVAGLAWEVWHAGPQRHVLGGWDAPLGIGLHADGLSVLMLLMTALVGLPVSWYAREYFQPSASDAAGEGHAVEPRHFWVLWLFLWGALNALFLSADVFNLYVALELITLAAVALVALNGGATFGAALRYLVAALVGSLLYLMAVALLYWSAGTLDIALLGATLRPEPAVTAAVALATLGLIVKSALFPLHFWLPLAHASAPAPVSAVLSALVVKASYYLVLRLWLDAFAGVVTADAALVVGTLGAAAIVWGSIQAMLVARLKLLVAYSTVAQIGYLFLVFPLVVAQQGDAAWQSGAIYALSHACAKAALFLAAGAILHAAGHDRLTRLHGFAARLPMPFMTIGLAGLVLMGLPPGGTFAAKWMMLDVALATGHYAVAAVVVAGGLLAAGYVFRILAPALSATPRDSAPLRPVPRGMRGSALLLAILAVLLGLATRPAVALLDVRAPAAAAGPAGGWP